MMSPVVVLGKDAPARSKASMEGADRDGEGVRAACTTAESRGVFLSSRQFLLPSSTRRVLSGISSVLRLLCCFLRGSGQIGILPVP
jgi:hypothetical protein